MTTWLANSIEQASGATVDIHDLACSSRDRLSRRVSNPLTWGRSSLCARDPILNHFQWGANAVELEFMRYRPRAELTEALNEYDLIQTVSGTAALALAASQVRPPVASQIATRAAWEREASWRRASVPSRAWRQSMTAVVSRSEVSALKHTDAVFVENPAMLQFAQGYCNGFVKLAPPGVDTSRFIPDARGWRSSGYLLSLCRFGDSRKGLPRLLSAYQKSVELEPRVPQLVVAGHGEVPVELQDLCLRLRIHDRVSFHTDIDPEDLADLYRGASVFVQTSYEEGLGMSTIEAMACGVPSVCAETEGSLVTIADSAAGKLVPQQPASTFDQRFAGAVLEVLRESGDTMASKARERALSVFSTEVAIARFLEVYQRLL